MHALQYENPSPLCYFRMNKRLIGRHANHALFPDVAIGRVTPLLLHASCLAAHNRNTSALANSDWRLPANAPLPSDPIGCRDAFAWRKHLPGYAPYSVISGTRSELASLCTVANRREKYVSFPVNLRCRVDFQFSNTRSKLHFLKRIRALNMASKVWHTELWKSWDKHGKNDL